MRRDWKSNEKRFGRILRPFLAPLHSWRCRAMALELSFFTILLTVFCLVDTVCISSESSSPACVPFVDVNVLRLGVLLTSGSKFDVELCVAPRLCLYAVNISGAQTRWGNFFSAILERCVQGWTKRQVQRRIRVNWKRNILPKVKLFHSINGNGNSTLDFYSPLQLQCVAFYLFRIAHLHQVETGTECLHLIADVKV